MPVHDWTRVEDSTFHDFRTSWMTHLKESLNEGLLPPSSSAQSEQHVGRKIADVLTLHASDPDRLKGLPPPEQGTVALADAAPRASRTVRPVPSANRRRRALTIRHTTGHRIVALV